MIPIFAMRHVAAPRFSCRARVLLAFVSAAACAPTSGLATRGVAAPAAATAAAATAGAATPGAATPGVATLSCLSSGDGYLRAKLGGAVEAQLDWPNSGTECQGESRGSPPGVRLSFRRDSSKLDLLLVFGLTGVLEGKPAREVAANVTVIVQGTSQIYGTLGDSRCTVDRLEQRPLAVAGSYRVEARGFCTQPAHAVRGSGDVLVSTFEFAGRVVYATGADSI